MNLSIKSPRSPFYYKFKKHKEKELSTTEFRDTYTNEDEEELKAKLKEIEEVVPIINDVINGLHWYDKLIFEYYYKGVFKSKKSKKSYSSVKQIAKATTIPETALQNTVNDVKEKIIELITKKQLL